MSTTRKNRKHSLSEKLKVVELYRSGYGSSTISKKLGIHTSIVKSWIRVYQTNGVLSLEKGKHPFLSTDLKERAVKGVLEKSLSFESVALKYHISKSAVYSWTQQVKIHGYEILSKIKQGRPTKEMGRPKKKQPETELEKLQEELRYLRAENAYLKKLRALVQERIARESGKQSGSSKN
jgi:transposase